MQPGELSDAKRRLLAMYSRGKLRTAAFSSGPAPALVATGDVPLSPAQERMWRHMQSTPGLTCYNEPVTFYRHGPLDLRLLERSFRELLDRHSLWRTVFPAVDGRSVQAVQPAPAVPIELSDLREFPGERREQEALRLASADAAQPFDLARGPLFRIRAIQLDENEYQIFVIAHHIILDGVTVFHLLFPELVAIYEARLADREPKLPELRRHYADFARWQRAQCATSAAADDLAYWREQLNGRSPLRLPSDFAPPAQRSYRGAVYNSKLPLPLAEGLRALGRQHGVTLFAVLTAAFAGLAHWHTGQQELLLGTVTPGGREQAEFEGVMGLLQNRLPLLVDIAGDPTLPELALRLRESLSETLSHDNAPSELIAESLWGKEDLRPSPLFETQISLAPRIADLGRGWDFTTMDADPGGARMDFYLEMNERPDGLLSSIQYDTELFTRATIARYAAEYRYLLETWAAKPERKLSELMAALAATFGQTQNYRTAV